MQTEADLFSELDAKHEAATPGDWHQQPFTAAGAVWISCRGEPIVEPAGPPERDEEQGRRRRWKLFRPWGKGNHREGDRWWKQIEANAALIVALRNAYPQIRDGYRAALKRVEEKDAEIRSAKFCMKDAEASFYATLKERDAAAKRVAELGRDLTGAAELAADLINERDTALGRVAGLELNCPYPWCPECKAECRGVDGDGLCSACGVEPIWPTAAMVGRVADLERRIALFLSDDEGCVIVHPGTDEDNTRLDVATTSWDTLCAAIAAGGDTDGR